MNLNDLQYKISLDYNKLTKEQKADFKKKLYDIIIADLAVEFLTDRVWNDEQFLERFQTSDRHRVLANNVNYYKQSAKVLEWVERYGDQSQELLAEYNITPPREHQFVYTVEQVYERMSEEYHLKYCSPDYETSLSELKTQSIASIDNKAVLIAWYQGKPEFAQWAEEGLVSDKSNYYGKGEIRKSDNRFTV